MPISAYHVINLSIKVEATGFILIWFAGVIK